MIGKEIDEDELQQEQRQQGLGAGSGGRRRRRRRAGAARLHLQEVDLPPLLRQLLHRPALHQQVTLPALRCAPCFNSSSFLWPAVVRSVSFISHDRKFTVKFTRSRIPSILSQFPVAHEIRGSWPPRRRPSHGSKFPASHAACLSSVPRPPWSMGGVAYLPGN